MESTSYHFIDILISVVLAFIMFGIGLSLTFDSFKNIFRYPKALILGLICQMIGLPIIAFIVVYFANLPAALKVGFIILAACPGGTTSGFVTYIFRGNVALSISLTSINSILTLFTIPIVVNFALQIFMNQSTEIHLPFLETLLQIFIVSVLPAFIGVSVRSMNSNLADKIQKPIKFLLIFCLGAVFLIKFLASENNGGSGITSQEILQILPYAIFFNLACMIFGYLTGRFPKLNVSDSFTIAIEVTLHNTTLALLVAGTLLSNQTMVKPALVYAMFSFWTMLIFCIVIKKINRLSVFEGFKIDAITKGH